MRETDYQELIYKRTYSRWLPDKNRREEWNETVDRYSDFMIKQVPDNYHTEFNIAIDSVMQKEVMPSMRALWAAGAALEREHIAAYNCSYITIDTLRSFSEMLYILMCGTGVGFSVERQLIVKLPEVPKMFYSDNTSSPIVFADSKRGWAEGYNKVINSLWNGCIPECDLSKIRPKGSLLKTFGGRACLTGDTVLYKDRKKSKQQNEITIKQLYEMQNSFGFWSNKPNHFCDVKIRSLNEETGVFYRNQPLRVIDNGIAPVYLIKTKNGYEIKATSNHRFLNSTGEYKHLSEFKIGELIAVNGSNERKTGICVDCGAAISRRAMRCKPCNDNAQLNPHCSPTTARARKECQSDKKSNCELCGHDGSSSKLQVHHKDGSPWNNDDDNKQTLCEKCHRIEDSKRNTFSSPYSHRYLSFDEIESIDYTGEERVFDLVMKAPDHNFVANGFVSHNSGPEPLEELINYTIKVVKNANGRKLNSIECHDLCCKIASVVVVGGVRRSACISLSNLSDDRMGKAKSGEFWITDPQRSLANNSVAYTEKPDARKFLSEWMKLVESKTGERGIFNRQGADYQVAKTGRRETGYEWGVNPCGEILLRPKEFCNLTEVIIKAEDTLEDILTKVRHAAIIGCVQSTLTDFGFISRAFRKNCEAERLLGVSLTGLRDHKTLNHRSPEAKRCLIEMKETAIETAREWSKHLGINMPTAITCVKPSGTVSQLVNSSSGLHPRYSEYYIRRVRISSFDPIAQMLVDQGMPWSPEVGETRENCRTMVFDFPQKAPEGSVLNDDVTATEQLKYWRFLKEYWCEHNPSCTIFVKDDEWVEVGSWVYSHWQFICGLSFLPADTGVYQLAPYEEISESKYTELVNSLPDLDFSKLSDYETTDKTEGSREYACVGTSCEL